PRTRPPRPRRRLQRPRPRSAAAPTAPDPSGRANGARPLRPRQRRPTLPPGWRGGRNRLARVPGGWHARGVMPRRWPRCRERKTGPAAGSGRTDTEWGEAMAAISRDEVAHLARLSRLAVT